MYYPCRHTEKPSGLILSEGSYLQFDFTLAHHVRFPTSGTHTIHKYLKQQSRNLDFTGFRLCLILDEMRDLAIIGAKRGYTQKTADKCPKTKDIFKVPRISGAVRIKSI